MPVTEQTRIAVGSVTSPAGGAVIAAITAPPDGLYDVSIKTLLTGTAETALTNMRLRENGVVVATIPSISAVGGWSEINLKNVEVNQGGGNLDVNAAATAVVGAVYTVIIEATRRG